MFRAVLSLRYIMLLASLGAAFGALLMFWEAIEKLGSGFGQILAAQGEGTQGAISAVMGATDSFLFGVVLVIFAYGITFGFVFDLPPEQRARLPQWMRIEGISELKRALIEVILVYLAVDFVTDIAESESHALWQNLVLPLSILLLAGALWLMGQSHGARSAQERNDPTE